MEHANHPRHQKHEKPFQCEDCGAPICACLTICNECKRREIAEYEYECGIGPAWED